MRFKIICSTDDGSVIYADNLSLDDDPDSIAEKARQDGYTDVVIYSLPGNCSVSFDTTLPSSS